MVVLYANMRSAQEAIALGIKGLKLLGIRVSPKAGIFSALVNLVRVMLKLGRIDIDEIIDMPLIQDGEQLNCMDLLVNTGTPAYFVNPYLYATLVLKGVIICLRYGNYPGSAVPFMGLATIVQTALGDYALGRRIAEMALRLNDRFVDKKVEPMVYHIFAFFIRHWKNHAKETLQIFERVHRLSMESGNFLYLGYAVSAAADYRLIIGSNLGEILAETEKYKDLIKQLKDPFILSRYIEDAQMAKALMGLNRDRCSLSGEGFDEEAQLARLRSENKLRVVLYADVQGKAFIPIWPVRGSAAHGRRAR